MRAEHILTVDDGYDIVRSLEQDVTGVWVLDEEGEPRLRIPDDLADGLLDDNEFAASLVAWLMGRIASAEQNAYQAGRDHGFGEGRRMVREALGLDALDRIASAIELMEARG